jgi:hypothetical protein
LRRSSFIAEGAARALEKLQTEGLANWGAAPLIPVCSLRIQNVPGDAAISISLRRAAEHPPREAPALDLASEETEPRALSRRLWLNTLAEDARSGPPISDLLDWFVQRYPDKDMASMLAGFGELVFHRDFDARFSDAPAREYPASDGRVEGRPVSLNLL